MTWKALQKTAMPKIQTPERLKITNDKEYDLEKEHAYKKEPPRPKENTLVLVGKPVYVLEVIHENYEKEGCVRRHTDTRVFSQERKADMEFVTARANVLYEYEDDYGIKNVDAQNNKEGLRSCTITVCSDDKDHRIIRQAYIKLTKTILE